ncbi:hypothetical protein C5B42_01545 [Candidatus Cerribacteria bacterium 'Amazon FNV 2010 28 9']|uniref:Uncharacterized protein n=1 Tax=Candidatus Cerribacteria bacterium 'Amazon FNV 2010 28 9' TaxID=2081795 RepID=A0A317JPD9_9BACT|nr:MAG: hypothetical protein C5B42_01545 [Candidatus Cerribacteria bacterium 'Amazon FNV 2010 28 9']
MPFPERQTREIPLCIWIIEDSLYSPEERKIVLEKLVRLEDTTMEDLQKSLQYVVGEERTLIQVEIQRRTAMPEGVFVPYPYLPMGPDTRLEELLNEYDDTVDELP